MSGALLLSGAALLAGRCFLDGCGNCDLVIGQVRSRLTTPRVCPYLRVSRKQLIPDDLCRTGRDRRQQPRDGRYLLRSI